jgi:hypothetical protein
VAHTPNEFWLAVHALCRAYEAEGETADERADNITEQFAKMSPVVQEQVMRDIQSLAVALRTVRGPVSEVYRRSTHQRAMQSS